MKIARRLFLKRGGVALAALGASSLWRPGLLGRLSLAAEAARTGSGKKILVCVFQRGAADVGLEVAFFEMDGWDTHANQWRRDGPARGTTP